MGDSNKDVREIDVVKDTRQENPVSRLQRDDLKLLLTKGLSRAERLIIILYYYEEMTMKEIGITLDLSESRVSQMHSSILGDRDHPGSLRVARQSDALVDPGQTQGPDAASHQGVLSQSEIEPTDSATRISAVVLSRTSSTVTSGASSVRTNRRSCGSISSTHRSVMIMSMHRR